MNSNLHELVTRIVKISTEAAEYHADAHPGDSPATLSRHPCGCAP